MADSQVQEVKDKSDILQIISERIELTRSGRNYKACCPFHAEKTPSFFVTPEMQSFKCFGCGESGDVISFVQKYDGLTFPEALEVLAKKAGVTLTRRAHSGDQEKRDRLFSLLELAKEYYVYLLTKHSVGKTALEYLWDRNIGPSLVEEFELGYSLQNWQGLLDYLTKKKGFSTGELEQAGLVIRGSSGYYDRFRGRVMFPLHDYTGRVVGFSGRVLEKEVKEAKYINSPETALYHKRELLYGMHLAKQHIRTQDRVVVVEGELDVVGSRRAGIKEVVAIKGSALTPEQIGLIRRLTRNVVLALDADEAGQEAMLRGMKLLEDEQMNLRVVDLSGGKDPDDISRDDPASWKRQVNEAESVYAYYLSLAKRNYELDSGQGKKEASRFLVPVLSQIENAVEQSYYVKKASQLLGVGQDVFSQELKKYERSGKISNTESSPPELSKRKLSRQEKLERYVLSLSLMHTEKSGEYLSQLSSGWFTEAYLRALVDEFKTFPELTNMSLESIRARLSSDRLPLLQELYTDDVSLFDIGIGDIEHLLEESIVELAALSDQSRIKWLTKQMTRDDLDPAELEDYRAELARIRTQSR